jgi:hypothetical protein
VRKRYHAPATPCDRLQADPRTSEEARARIETLRADFNAVRLRTEIRSGQEALVAIPEGAVILPLNTSTAPIPVADFLAGLRTA